MPEIDDPTPIYTYLDVETVHKLDHAAHLLSEGLRRLRIDPKLSYAFSYEGDNGQLHSVVMDARFLFGVWAIRESLVQDLSAHGHKETAGDIVARWEARR